MLLFQNNDFTKYSGESKAGSSLEASWSQSIFIEQVLYAEPCMVGIMVTTSVKATTLRCFYFLVGETDKTQVNKERGHFK